MKNTFKVIALFLVVVLAILAIPGISKATDVTGNDDKRIVTFVIVGEGKTIKYEAYPGGSLRKVGAGEIFGCTNEEFAIKYEGFYVDEACTEEYDMDKYFTDGETIYVKSRTTGDEQGTTTEPTTGDEQGTTTEPTTGNEQGTTTEPTTGDEQSTTTEPTTDSEQSTTTESTTGDEQSTTTESTTGDEQSTTTQKTDAEKDVTPKTGVASHVGIAAVVAIVSLASIVVIKKRNA